MLDSQAPADPNRGWHTTSATFIDALFSHDFDRFESAYKRFVDSQYSTLWRQVRSCLSGYPAADVGGVVQNVLLRMFEVIWLKQDQLRDRTCSFRACFYTWARDAVHVEQRRLSADASRRQSIESASICDGEVEWDNLTPCVGDFVTEFMRRELLGRVWKLLESAEHAVQSEVEPRHWLVWKALRNAQVCWWIDETSEDQLLWLEIARKDWPDLEPVNGRKIISRVRSKVLQKLRTLTEAEGWDLNDLFD